MPDTSLQSKKILATHRKFYSNQPEHYTAIYNHQTRSSDEYYCLHA